MKKFKLILGFLSLLSAMIVCGGDGVKTDFTTFDKGQCKIDLSSGNTNTVCRK